MLCLKCERVFLICLASSGVRAVTFGTEPNEIVVLVVPVLTSEQWENSAEQLQIRQIKLFFQREQSAKFFCESPISAPNTQLKFKLFQNQELCYKLSDIQIHSNISISFQFFHQGRGMFACAKNCHLHFSSRECRVFSLLPKFCFNLLKAGDTVTLV